MRAFLGQKIVLASRGTSGDVIPLVGLGKQLQAWATAPLLAVAREFESLVRRAGCYHPAINPVFEGTFSPSSTTVLVPPKLMRQPLPTDPPGPIRYAGFGFFDGSPLSLPAEIDAFLADGEPPLVFTMGSSAVAVTDRYHRAWSAMSAMSAMSAKRGWRAHFLSAGQDHALPATQRLVPWVSVAALFPRCRGGISAGGIGTSGQIVRAGVPQMVVPINSDQPDNAARLARMGASLTVRSMQALGPAMEVALLRLVYDKVLHRRARQLQSEINQVCGLETTARWLDEDLRRSNGAVGTHREALRA